MLSMKVHKVIKLYFGWTNFIKIYPYVYDSSHGQIKLTDKQRNWYLISTLLLTHGLFVTTRIFYDYFFVGGRTEDFVFRFFFIAASGLGATNQINSYYYKHDVAACMNAYLEFDHRCSRLFQTREVTDVCALFIGILFPSIVISQCVIFAGLYIYNPKSPNYLNSLWTSEKYGLFSFLMVIPEMAIFIVTWSSVYFSLLIVFTFQMSAKYWLRQISVCGTIKKTTRPAIRKPEEAMFLYRQLQILNKMFNNAMADIYQPFHSFLMSGIFVSTSFTSVRFYDKMHWFPYSINPLTSVAVVIYNSVSYPTAAGILISSDNFRHAWKRSLTDAMTTKTTKFNYELRLKSKKRLWFLRSCPQMRIRMGRQFWIERHTLITVLDIMVDQTITLLVGVKKH